MRNAALLLIAVIAASAARADEVFRWVDENGKVHYGSSIPDRYKDKGRKVEDPIAPTDDQRRDAEDRAARDRAASDASRNRSKPQGAPQAGGASQPASKAAQTSAECEAYLRSLECFGPYRTRWGGIRAEAFEHCVEVKQPRGCAPEQPSAPTYLPPAEAPNYPPR